LQWRLNELGAAAESFRRALHLVQVGPEHLHLRRMLARAVARSDGLLPQEEEAQVVNR
jgi:hypothetical protein